MPRPCTFGFRGLLVGSLLAFRPVTRFTRLPGLGDHPLTQISTDHTEYRAVQRSQGTAVRRPSRPG